MSMSDSVGDFILQRLADGGIKRVFGYPGDGINGLMGAMRRAADRLQQARREKARCYGGLGCFTGLGDVA